MSFVITMLICIILIAISYLYWYIIYNNYSLISVQDYDGFHYLMKVKHRPLFKQKIRFFVGSGTVWRHYPSGVRVSSCVQLRLCNLLQQWKLQNKDK